MILRDFKKTDHCAPPPGEPDLKTRQETKGILPTLILISMHEHTLEMIFRKAFMGQSIEAFNLLKEESVV